MKHSLIAMCAVLLFLAACSPATPIPPTATLLPLPTIDPNARPVPLAEIDLAPFLIQPGDLPTEVSGEQITSTRPPEVYDEKLPRPENEIHQQLQQSGKYGGRISVFLYKSNGDLAEAYRLITDNFPGTWKSPAVTSENKTLVGVGEKATISAFDDLGYFMLVDIAFVRCKAVAHVKMIDNRGIADRSGRTIDVMAAEATSYAEHLDRRLSQVVCR